MTETPEEPHEEVELDPWGEPVEEEDDATPTSSTIGDFGSRPIAARRKRAALWIGLFLFSLAAVLYFGLNDAEVIPLILAILGGWLISAYLRS